MPKATVETLSVEYLSSLHTRLTQILKDNGLISCDPHLDQQKIAAILEPITKIQI